ncbi:MAG: DUF4231 domain-containing protein [Nanoarchaeota archaeon]|nr:DUF4231 domain-containing protein [Nanoarchaeota archaeon]
MVNKQLFDKYVKNRYEDQVKWYDKKSVHNQRLAKRYQITIIILSAITPVLAALEFKWPTIISAALVTAAASILKYCKYEDHWHNYRTTCETLKKEKIMYESEICPYETSTDKMKVFIERAEALISKENTVWTEIISKDKQKNKKR